MVSPIFIRNNVQKSRGWLNSNQSSTVWQVEIQHKRISSRANKVRRENGLRSAGELFFQVRLQKFRYVPPRILCILCTISLFVIGVLEGVTRVWVDDNVYFLAELLHGLLKLFHVFDRDAAIFSTKNSKNGER